MEELRILVAPVVMEGLFFQESVEDALGLRGLPESFMQIGFGMQIFQARRFRAE